MSSDWALIDARSTTVAPALRVAGLSLIARHARMVHRAGFAGLVVIADDSRDEVQRALAAEPAPAELVVEIIAGADAPAAGRLYRHIDLSAVYTKGELVSARESGRAPTPLATVGDAEAVSAAERALFGTIRKTIDQDGVVAYYMLRPVTRVLTRALVDTKVHPNHVSLLAMTCSITAAISAAMGGYQAGVIAGLVYWFGGLIDCIDGDLARLRVQGSKLGEWLDTLADDVGTHGLLLGLGIGLYRSGYAEPWAFAGVGAAVLGALVHARLYADLHRWGLTIDTAEYPWFFGAPAAGAQGGRSLVGRIFYCVSFLFRRDAFVTMTAGLLIAGWQRMALVLLGGGVGVVVALFVVHNAVQVLKRRDPP